MLYINKAK